MDCHIPLFDNNMMDTDINKVNFMYWCKFYYQNVYSLEEEDRPNEYVLEHDILLDDWLEKKIFKEKNKNRGVRYADNNQEVYTIE